MSIALQVEVPIASFRQSEAREYAQTYPVPPPSTVYGMLLSTIGEMDRYKHCGVQLAIALLSEPEKSTIVRTIRRFKKKDIQDPANARPDFQELLTQIHFIVWIDAGMDKSQPTLPERLLQAFAHPEAINRFGGLSLGESRDLVNAITLVENNPTDASMQWLIRDEDGLLSLPYWVDHVGSKGTFWQRYTLQKNEEVVLDERIWTTIQFQ